MSLDMYFPSGVAKKYVDAFLERQILQEEPVAVLSGQARTVRGLGPDSPRPGTGARVSCLTAGRSAPWGRTVRAYAGVAEDHRRRLDLAPGRDPVEEERS
jgi:hypothetical protein